MREQGLNWQARLIEEAQGEIKVFIRDEVLAGKRFVDFRDELNELIDGVVEELESEPLKERVRIGLGSFSNKVYIYMFNMFRGASWLELGAMLSILKSKANKEQERVVLEFAESIEGYEIGVPLDIFAKDYMQKVNERVARLSRVEAKDDLSGRVSLRNIAEMQVRQEKNTEMIESFIERGEKLAWIQPHANASERCEPWQGKLYSLDGTSGVIDGIRYEPLERAMNIYHTTNSGRVYKNGCISGFNCRHKLVAYKKGSKPIEIPAEVVEREREVNDRQRYLERGVRAWRERAMLLKGVDDETYKKARKNAIEWNMRYEDYSKRNNVAFYPSRVKV